MKAVFYRSDKKKIGSKCCKLSVCKHMHRVAYHLVGGQ